MTSLTRVAPKVVFEPRNIWRPTARGGGPGAESSGDANRETIDWFEAPTQIGATFVYFSSESNSYPEIPKDWASLATAARNSWLRDNPF